MLLSYRKWKRGWPIDASAFRAGVNALSSAYHEPAPEHPGENTRTCERKPLQTQHLPEYTGHSVARGHVKTGGTGGIPRAEPESTTPPKIFHVKITGTNMNIYHITRKCEGNVGYDEYVEYVVVAESERWASSQCEHADEGDIWKDESKTDCVVIGTGDGPERVVAASFNAG